MSYLPENSLYYLVLFNQNFNIFGHPFYSLPGYDKKNRGIQKLEQHIIHGEIGKKHPYAIIYNNETKQAIRYYKNGIQTECFNIPKPVLKLWLLKNDKTTETHTIEIKNEKADYWYLINKHIKAQGKRANLKYARVYLIIGKKEEIISEFHKEKYDFVGKGKYHKEKLLNI